MVASEKLDLAESILGYRFHDRDLLAKALTHPSAVEGHAIEDSYERLEFLGDSILGATVSLSLYERFPAMNEGQLTRIKTSLVSGGKLSEVAQQLGLDNCIVFGESEMGTGGRGMRSALENVFESLIGALYLDGGSELCLRFVRDTLFTVPAKEMARRPISEKSRLQEITQSKLHCAPVYELVAQEGPAHEPRFTTEVTVAGKVLGMGQGSTKKESQTAAAKAALERLKGEPSHEDAPAESCT